MIERAYGADGVCVHVEFQLTQEEFRAFARWQVRRSKVVRRLAILIAFEFVLGAVLAFTAAAVVGATLLVLSIAQVVLYAALFATAPARAWKKATPGLRGQQVIEFSDAGVHAQSTNSESESRWAMYTRTVQLDDLYLLGVTGNKFILIPRRAFASPDDEARFRAIVADHTAAELR